MARPDDKRSLRLNIKVNNENSKPTPQKYGSLRVPTDPSWPKIPTRKFPSDEVGDIETSHVLALPGSPRSRNIARATSRQNTPKEIPPRENAKPNRPIFIPPSLKRRPGFIDPRFKRVASTKSQMDSNELLKVNIKETSHSAMDITSGKRSIADPMVEKNNDSQEISSNKNQERQALANPFLQLFLRPECLGTNNQNNTEDSNKQINTQAEIQSNQVKNNEKVVFLMRNDDPTPEPTIDQNINSEGNKEIDSNCLDLQQPNTIINNNNINPKQETVQKYQSETSDSELFLPKSTQDKKYKNRSEYYHLTTDSDYDALKDHSCPSKDNNDSISINSRLQNSKEFQDKCYKKPTCTRRKMKSEQNLCYTDIYNSRKHIRTSEPQIISERNQFSSHQDVKKQRLIGSNAQNNSFDTSIDSLDENGNKNLSTVETVANSIDQPLEMSSKTRILLSKNYCEYFQKVGKKLTETGEEHIPQTRKRKKSNNKPSLFNLNDAQTLNQCTSMSSIMNHALIQSIDGTQGKLSGENSIISSSAMDLSRGVHQDSIVSTEYLNDKTDHNNRFSKVQTIVLFAGMIYALIVFFPMIYDYLLYEEYDEYENLGYLEYALEYVTSSFYEAFGGIFELLAKLLFRPKMYQHNLTAQYSNRFLDFIGARLNTSTHLYSILYQLPPLSRRSNKFFHLCNILDYLCILIIGTTIKTKTLKMLHKFRLNSNCRYH